MVSQSPGFANAKSSSLISISVQFTLRSFLPRMPKKETRISNSRLPSWFPHVRPLNLLGLFSNNPEREAARRARQAFTNQPGYFEIGRRHRRITMPILLAASSAPSEITDPNSGVAVAGNGRLSDSRTLASSNRKKPGSSRNPNFTSVEAASAVNEVVIFVYNDAGRFEWSINTLPPADT